MSIVNRSMRKLDCGDAVAGAWLLSGSTRAAEVLSRTSVDWVAIDTEHAPHSPERVEALVRAVEPHATPLVRLPSVETAVSGGAKHALDSGAKGVIVPGVETPEDADSVVRATHFPPVGERGVAGTTRANTYGEEFDDYVTTANEETLLTVQIESPAAVERVEEILAVDGIDVAFIGENDLSAAYGHPGEKDHPDVTTAVERVFEAAKANDVYPGIAGRTPEIKSERTERGFRFFLLGADLSFMRTGVEDFLNDSSA
ncbi:2-dehydro-3-deoxyglucarate aldolase [Haladaptatus paucihalophilus DX253]|uniref:2-dehydro-3-deoxyglucarate aldolase n=1 Tax=Haladaptatus paucihalophilus DX253 TaxID=797209 RepID=E7QNW0_HALPU|nr:aldolase/citrate lyase family protein [Haladaptatus paucihalophilus]EFW93613.1 2-dehydro-3-deoxyglucarate aldolase [Haladaptatus paucihalophilus DX253]SHL45526.1 2-dehydro-3-deoxyglucarate aldolase/4-hydroxy-2-oxoheptanedioate aldolase [Haladaptatus paucihalophilus DX253]